MKSVKWSIALDGNNKEMKVGEATKGQTYFCMACGNEMFVRKSSTGLMHFVHKRLPDNYSYESELHFYCKKILHQYLNKHIVSHKPLSISQTCGYCRKRFSVDITSGINHVAMEQTYVINGKTVRPDIALVKDNRPICVIEIVVTHAPEEDVLDAYDSQNILTIEIQVDEQTPDISVETLLDKAYMYIDRCDTCRQKLLREKEASAGLNKRRESNKLKYFDAKIEELIAQAEEKGYPILPLGSWRLFQAVQSSLGKNNNYSKSFEVKSQAGMFFIDIGIKRFFIDQFYIRSQPDAISSIGFGVFYFFRTYKKVYPYGISFHIEDWMIKRVAVRRFASYEQMNHYQRSLGHPSLDY